MTASLDRYAPSRVGLVCETILVATVVGIYLGLWRLYGFDLVDEGTQLLQIVRATGGDRPYTDFETGYTPGYFRLLGGVWRLGGFVAVRSLLLLMHVVVAGLVYALLRSSGSRTSACVGVLAMVAFLLPISLGTGAPSNIPYPGWLALPVAVLTVAGLSRSGFAERVWALRLLIFFSGFGAAAVFSVKPNTGLFLLGGALLALSSTWSREGRFERVGNRLLRLGALLALGILLYPVLFSRLGIALLLPGLLAVVAAAPARRGGRSTGCADAILLLAGFACLTIPWLVELVGRIGLMPTLENVFFLGDGARSVFQAYAVEAPVLHGGTIALLSSATVALWLSGKSASRWSPALLLLGAATAGFFVWGESIREWLENLLFWLCPVVLTLGLMTVGRDREQQEERLLLILAAFLFLTIYPRPDLIHVAQIGPVVLLAGICVWRRFRSLECRQREADGTPYLSVSGVLALVVVVLACGRMWPTLGPRLTEPMVTQDLGPHVTVSVVESELWYYAEIADLVGLIRRETPASQAVFTFPDLAGLAFLAERPSPFFYLYFVPGRPDPIQAERVAAQWSRIAPGLVILGKPRVPAFRNAPGYFSELLDFTKRHSQPSLRLGNVEVRRVSAAPERR